MLAPLSAALILLVYALTEGPEQGWRKAGVLTPLIISILLFPAFAFYETFVKDPILPSKVWRFPNFALLLVVASKYVPLCFHG